jgi:hypothetical protein
VSSLKKEYMGCVRVLVQAKKQGGKSADVRPEIGDAPLRN